jgi:hypothetical protein
MWRLSAGWPLILFVIATIGSASAPGRAQQVEAALPIETEGARALADERLPFAGWTGLAERVRTEMDGTTDRETSGRLALLWVRAMRAALMKIPMDARNQEPYREFLRRHQSEVVYSEPAGEWLLHVETIWSLYDRHRASSSADAVAWEAAENTLPGECEGYPPCELAALDMLYGEYLRRQPRGEHAEEAVRRIGTACDELQRLLDSPGGHEFFNPVTDCVDLTPKADALATALEHAGVDASAATASLGALSGRCGSAPGSKSPRAP